MNKLIFIFLSLIILPGILQAQQINGFETSDQNLIMQVKQLDQFIKRFNYIEDFDGKKINQDFEQAFSRNKYLNYLFNLQDARLNPDDNNYSKAYNDLIVEFKKEVCSENNPKYLNFISNRNFIVAKSIFLFQGKDTEFTIWFKLEADEYGTAKWIIYDVDSELIDIPLNYDLNSSIPPNSNETSFIVLNRSFEDKNNLISLYNPDFTYDKLSAFSFMINQDIIKFKHIYSMTYILLDIDGWALEIENFKRKSLNNGWLINQLVSLEDNKEYLNNRLHIENVPKQIIADIKEEAVSLRKFCPEPMDRDKYDPYGLFYALSYNAGTILWARNLNITNPDSILQIAFSPFFSRTLINDKKYLPPDEQITINNTLYNAMKVGMIPLNQFGSDDNTIDQELITEAANYRIDDYFNCIQSQLSSDKNINSIRNALKRNNPVIIGFNAPPSFSTLNDSIWIPLENESHQKEYSPLVLTLIGFDDNTGCFEIMNSSGIKWADKGFCKIRFQDLINYSITGFEISKK